MNIWEPLIIGWTIIQDDDVGKINLYQGQLDTIAEMSQEIGEDIRIDLMLPSGPTTTEILLQFELVGLAKAFGYVTLSGDTLFDKFREFGVNENMPFDNKIITDLLGVMRRDFAIIYFRRNRKYPLFASCPIPPCENT